nr:hypothetical protein Iba_chr11aCG4150 [Ipomoea batatas]GMD58494.1 hypothetical protein Iba_chr11fCG6090 [Ipomoea batatas]
MLQVLLRGIPGSLLSPRIRAVYQTETSTAYQTMQTDKEITPQKICPKLISEQGNSVQLWRRRSATVYVPGVVLSMHLLRSSPPLSPQLSPLYTQCDTELHRMDSRT